MIDAIIIAIALLVTALPVLALYGWWLSRRNNQT